MSSALAGRFLTIGPPGKSPLLKWSCSVSSPCEWSTVPHSAWLYCFPWQLWYQMQWAEVLRLLFLVVSTVMILALPPCSWSPPLTLVISAWCSGWHLSKPEDIALIHYIDDIMQIGLSEQEVVTIADIGFVLSAASRNLWDLSSPTRGSNLCPQQWKWRILSIGTPVNSPDVVLFFSTFFFFFFAVLGLCCSTEAVTSRLL